MADKVSEFPSKDDFMRVYGWISQNSDFCDENLDINKSRGVLVREFLDCFKNSSWKDGNASSVDISIARYESADCITGLAVDVRKYLQFAYENLPRDSANLAALSGVLYVKRVKKEGLRRYKLIWDNPSQEPSAGEKVFKRIVIVGSLRTGELNAEIMRGIRSMASELGIELDDRMEWNWLRKHETESDPNPISRIVHEAEVDPSTDAILVRNQDYYDLTGNIGLLKEKGYHVVTTGFANGDIRQNLLRIGSRLAERCIEDQKRLGNTGEGYFVIIHKYNDLESNSTAIESVQKSFLSMLNDKGRFEVIYFDPTPYYGLHYELMKERYTAFLDEKKNQLGPNKIAAILVPDESYGLAAFHAFREEKSPDLYRIYSERIVRSMLEVYRISGQHLHAACGVEPYYFGRYAVRAASMVPEIPFFMAPPVLVTKEDIERGDLLSPDRIPAYFNNCDVQFNEEKYAWYPWMRKLCPSSYGPTLLAMAKTEAKRMV